MGNHVFFTFWSNVTKKKPQLKFKIKKKGQITHLHDDPTEGLVVGGHIKKHPRQSTHL